MEERPPPDERASLAQLLPGAVTGLSFKLGMVSVVIVSAVVAASTAYAYLGERDQLLASMQRAATTQARLTLTGLESAMLENNRTLKHDLVSAYAHANEVDDVFVADATGNVAVTSVPNWAGRRISLPSDVCPTCPLPEHTTRVDFDPQHSVLRSLTVIPNEATCYRCHPAGQRMLGVLGVDFAVTPLQEARSAIVKRMVLWGIAVAVVVLFGEWAVVYLGALRRLRALREATRSLRPGTKAGTSRDDIGAIADDIRWASTALHDTQEEVARQRRFMVELMDKVEDGVAVVDRDRVLVAANSSYLRRVGVTREAMAQRGLRCGDSSLCGQSEEECPTRRAFRTGRLEKRIHRRANSEAFEEVFASPILGADNRVEFVVETWRDVTERLSLQANLARSEQLAAVGTLATGFSHEISTPLGTVSTLIQGVQRLLVDRQRVEGDELAKLRQRLELATREVFRCRDITRSLLDLGRKKRTLLDQVSVDQVLERMVEVVRPTAERQAITVALERASEVPMVLGHADQLEQVVLNLCMNAVEAMPDGGALKVRVGPVEGGVEVVVADTGPGVAPEDAARIFEPFFTRKAGGTGLGLYVSRQIIEGHGGRLELDPAGPGTRFRVFLPFSRPGGPLAPAPTRA